MSPEPVRDLLGTSPAMQEARELVERSAPSMVTVLVRGESGTGKELAARALHRLGLRPDGPFVKIDCAALPEHLLESELFGYEKGAFTGAAARKPGRVEVASGGTLFLDEIGELTEALQAKLLSLLQDRVITHLGGVDPIPVDVRVVAATHRDLETMVEHREFRQDLFYRLNVVPIWLPPLRARRDDIELLARIFVERSARAHGKEVVFDESALRQLRRQRWPGNVRQLENFVERMVVLTRAPVVDAAHVDAELSRQVTFATEPASVAPREPDRPPGAKALQEELKAAEKRAVEQALVQANGNRTDAAKILGISRSHLYALLAEHGMLDR
jgi:two-component system response regulator AtoC